MPSFGVASNRRKALEAFCLRLIPDVNRVKHQGRLWVGCVLKGDHRFQFYSGSSLRLAAFDDRRSESRKSAHPVAVKPAGVQALMYVSGRIPVFRPTVR